MYSTSRFESQIIPLLHRMINLQELTLFLFLTKRYSTFIDGVKLHDEILVHMPELNKFTFSINNAVMNSERIIDLQSNEDIQQSFVGKGYGQVGSYIHHRTELNVGMLHVYSLPYQFEWFIRLNNSFQVNKFDKVKYLSLADPYPFEHNFFDCISQNFLFVKELHIANCQPQTNKGDSSMTLIKFPHLILLNLAKAHADYAKQFLSDKLTYLPCLLDLCIKYESLVIATNNFSNDSTRVICGKLKRLHTDAFVRPKTFHQYFPLL